MGDPTGTAYDYIRVDIRDAKCGKTGKYRLREVVENEVAICAYCGVAIDLSSEEWRSLLLQLAEEFKQIKKLR